MAHKALIQPILMIILAGISSVNSLHAQPLASFTATPKSGCSPLKVDFQNQSTGAVRCQWIFGNSNGSTLVNPSSVYNVPGKYSVALIVWDKTGKSDTAEFKDYITVFKTPVSSFAANKRELCATDSVLLIDQSKIGDAGIMDYSWDLGNGQVLHGSFIHYSYNAKGKYSISLAVKDSNGCLSTTKEIDHITVNELPSGTINSDISAKCAAPAMVKFKADARGNGPFEFQWDFGDSTVSLSQNPAHNYLKRGNYSVVLRIRDKKGCQTILKSATGIQINPPKANYLAPNSPVCINQAAQFWGRCSPIDSSSRYLWNFGDGDSMNTQENPNKIFPKSGSFTVRLRYIWDKCTSNIQQPLIMTVQPEPDVHLSARDTILCRNPKLKYKLTAGGNNISAITWFRDTFKTPVNITNNEMFIHQDSLRTLKVRVTAASVYGCGSARDSVTIKIAGPFVSADISKTSGCMPYNSTASFNGASDCGIASYHWRCERLNVSANGPVLKFVNDKFGLNILTLSVQDNFGCRDSAAYLIGAGLKFPAVYKTNKKQICNNEPFWVMNNSPVKASDSVSFFWSWFNKDTLPFPGRDSAKLKFRTFPKKNVSLTFTNNSFGCTTRDEIFIDVFGPYLKGNVHAYCDLDSVIGINQSVDYTKTWWQYKNPKAIKTDAAKSICIPLQSTNNLWLYATNDTTNCSDSLAMPYNTDGQDANFDYSIDCETHILQTFNKYKGIADSNFIWTLSNLSTGVIQNFKRKNLDKLFLGPANYELKLAVNNKKFVCTKSKTVKFRIVDPGAMKPTVCNISKSCNPIILELQDSFYQNWNNPKWNIDGKIFIRDSTIKIVTIPALSKPVLWVHLIKYDPIGCLIHDSVEIKVGGPLPAIEFLGQNDQDCLHPVLSFNAKVTNNKIGEKYQYFWDFGFKKSNKTNDTVKMPGSGILNVTLSISDDRGCMNSIGRSFQVKAGKPKAQFKVLADTLIACPPLYVSFQDTSLEGSAPVTFRKWSFGDNSYSDKINPSRMFVIPGEYDISLIVGNKSNCYDTITKVRLAVVKGPKGSFTIDKNHGCTPLKVDLSATYSKGVSKIAFDMGDGTVLNSNFQNHNYKLPGTYVPRIILTDSNGCQYSPEPKDTIRVYARPVAQLTGGTVCRNTEYILSHNSYSMDSINSVFWSMNRKNVGTSHSVKLQFNEYKINNVGLIITTTNQCSDTTNAVFAAYSIKASLQVAKDEWCLGNKIHFDDRSASDTGIAQKWLYVNNQNISNMGMNYYANKRGRFPVKFIIKNLAGCMDSFSDPCFIKVGDTAQPPELRIYRTTVVCDESTETRFSMSKEPDFKDANLYVYRQNNWEKMATTSNIMDTNLLANGLNTLNKSWCHKIIQRNYCGISTDISAAKPHCTIETKAFGDTNTGLVKWSPYIGWGETSKYRIWRKPYQKGNFTLIDSVKGNVLCYRDTSIQCNLRYDYKIEGKAKYDLHLNSFSDTANCKPVHFMPVPEPELRRTSVEENKFVFSEWDMPVKHAMALNYFTLYRNTGNNWEIIAEKLKSDQFKFIDNTAEFQKTENNYYITATDVCNVTSKPSNIGRNIVLQVKPSGENQDALLSWTPYIFWKEGVQNYTVERSISGSEFYAIGTTGGNELQFTDSDIPKNCIRDIIYRVTAVKNPSAPQQKSVSVITSMSNYTAFIPEIRFFIPNAFTPNENNLNEQFKPNGVFFSGYEMKIFNRWGQKVYEGADCLNSWDGKYENIPAPEGVYAYQIIARDLGGKPYNFNGTITLMR